jgi:uncharacterized membrane protein
MSLDAAIFAHAPSATEPPPVGRGEALWLAATLAVALLLRTYGIDASLWYDEIDTLVHHTRQPVSAMLTTYPSLNHHVLFTLEAKAALILFGESAWALRLPAVLLGVASVWALWLVARQVVPVREALLSAVLLTVSYHHVWFSQNARGYTGLLFFGLIATYFLLRAARRGSWWDWTAYAVAGALAVYTHLTAAFFLASHAAVYLGVLALRWRSSRSPDHDVPDRFPGFAGVRPLCGFGLSGLLATLLYAPMIPQMVATFTAVAVPQSPQAAASIAEWKSPLWMILEVGRSLGPGVGIALPLMVAVVVLGAARLRGPAALVSATFLVHIVLTLAVLVVGSFRVWPRYFFIDIGFICLFLIHGAFVIGAAATRIAARAGWRVHAQRVGTATATLGIAASLVLLPRNYLYPKQDFRGARDFVESQRTGASAVVTLGLATMPYAAYYAPQWQAVETPEALERLRSEYPQLWLVYAFPAVTERRYNRIMEYLTSRFERVKRFPGTLGGGDIVVLRSIAP